MIQGGNAVTNIVRRTEEESTVHVSKISLNYLGSFRTILSITAVTKNKAEIADI